MSDFQRVAGWCEAAARYSQLASEFLPGSAGACVWGGGRYRYLSKSACVSLIGGYSKIHFRRLKGCT